MPQWFHTQSTVKTRTIQCRRLTSNKSDLPMATMETVIINPVTMIVIDWNIGTHSGWHYWYQRTTGKISIVNGYIYTPCILDYDKHICIPTELGNSALDMKQSFISCYFYSCCSWFTMLLTIMVFTNPIEPIDVLKLYQDLRLWRMCSSGGIFHNPNVRVWFQCNSKYIDTPPSCILSIHLLINFYLKNDFS